MNPLESHPIRKTAFASWRDALPRVRRLFQGKPVTLERDPPDRKDSALGATILLYAAIIALNLPLLTGGPLEGLVFDPSAVLKGEVWRLFTHPFVHVNGYHFALDAGAFALLWTTRPGPKTLFHDLRLLFLCALGSLAGAMMWNGDLVAAHGFCGLSGIGHGLMATHAASWASRRNPDPTARRFGLVLLIGLFAKGLYETLTGTVFLADLHIASVGRPITACHLGGALGGIFAHKRTKTDVFHTWKPEGEGPNGLRTYGGAAS